MVSRALSLALLLALAILVLVIKLERQAFDPGGRVRTFSEYLLNNPRHILYQYTFSKIAARREDCNFYNCFDVNRCSLHNGNIKVHIYPSVQFTNGDRTLEPSAEFLQILDAIAASEFYTDDPEEACLFIPSVDTLNINNNRRDIESILPSLEHWNQGTNHLIFNFIGDTTTFGIDKALLASSTFSTYTYRPSFDISLPLFVPESSNPSGQNLHLQQIQHDRTSEQNFSRQNPQLSQKDIQPNLELPLFRHSAGNSSSGSSNQILLKERIWKLLVILKNLDKKLKRAFTAISDVREDLILVNPCTNLEYAKLCYKGNTYRDVDLMSKSQYCLITGVPFQLYLAVRHGCLPVIIQDSSVLPFSEVLDWSLISIRVRRRDLRNIMSILDSHTAQYSAMKKQLERIYQAYFSSPARIALTTLRIINSRIMTQKCITKEDWNLLDTFKSPLFLDRFPRPNTGFTAVILTYNRIESLFQIIKQISSVPSLSRILVVWNHQTIHPPPVDQWPKVNKQMKVVQTPANKLSNRFYPYAEIETECVFSLDDDITMLSVDEIEFGFQVWREFPDRIVGFPSRQHLWNETTSSWTYESEWRNEISMILTGAAFYNSYWNYVYTAGPGFKQREIRDWVDENMNCEDIAFNFMVANQTNQSVIKVGPRKKYRCVTVNCENGSMLSQDAAHLARRTQCVERFAKIYGRMPLKSVEFRVDPVLYKDNVPESINKFDKLGPL